MTSVTLSFALILLYLTLTDNAEDIDEPSDKLSETPSPSYLNCTDLNCGERKRRLPQAIIIGSRKSGTRALLKFLGVNPAIRSACKEVHFFDKPENFKLGIDWYQSQMPKSRASDITIEKSPSYFVTPKVAERVKAMNSSIKLVLILRDPVTRLISDYSQLVANRIGVDDDKDARDYIASSGVSLDYEGNSSTSESIWRQAEKSFEKYVLRPDGGIDDQRRAVKIGMYSVYLEQWKAQFPLKQFHFVDGETLINNPYEELHKLEIFLGAELRIQPSDFAFNSRKGFYCLALSNPTNVSTRSRRSSSQQFTAIEYDDEAPGCLSRSKGRRHVNVSQGLIEKLQKFYAPYNQYLESLSGKKFEWS